MRDAIGERRAVHELQHERLNAVRLLEAVDRRDVRMVERRKELRLSFEAGEAVRIEPEGFGQDLERDVPIQSGVAGPIDLAHPARTDRSGDLVWADARTGRQRHSPPILRESLMGDADHSVDVRTRVAVATWVGLPRSSVRDFHRPSIAGRSDLTPGGQRTIRD